MTMFGLERTVKSGQEKFILKFHHVQNYFPSICKMEKFCHETQICSAISLHFCTTYTTYTVRSALVCFDLILQVPSARSSLLPRRPLLRPLSSAE